MSEAFIREQIRLQDKTLYLDLWPFHYDTIELGLEHVRASDGIRIRYDFDRDGWVILQDSDAPDKEDGDWQEVAFIQSWARYKRQD